MTVSQTLGRLKVPDNIAEPTGRIVQANRHPFTNQGGKGGFQLGQHMRTINRFGKSRAVAEVLARISGLR